MKLKFWERSQSDLPAEISDVDVMRQRRGSLFSTDLPKPSALDYMKRIAMATSMSIQIVPGSFKPVGPNGEAMDSGGIEAAKVANHSVGYLPIGQFEWYAGQGFIGWQACAIISQHWLIDKACSLPGKDAVRHGFEISVNNGDQIDPKVFDDLRRLDKKFKLKKNMIEFIKFGRVFGIRHAMFIVDGIDYELPFNPDGVKPGSYKGITQIDPYWLAPELDASAAANPAAKDFYEPTWWRVNGKRVHKSHFIIFRNGDDVPDILKPSYIYGGIPTPQKIAERVYGAEKTANEGPMLAMTKRMTIFKTDLSEAITNADKFNERMAQWAEWMNNFGIKIVGAGDEVDQHETSLADLDATIMTQYQLVAAGSNVPVTKLLGTTPKGFNATGEYDESSYHEELESIQENDLTPFVERHLLLCIKSYIAPRHALPEFNAEINWLPVDSPTAKEVAETNKLKADTDAVLVNAGVLDGFDVRQRLIKDRDSEYDGIDDIVPGGPGDRAAEQEEKNLMLEGMKDAGKPDGFAEDESLGYFDAKTGKIGEARIITHQKFIDDAIVLEKIKARDFVVTLTPEFLDDGKKYRMVIDGHHSLAAALASAIMPIFIEGVPRDVVFNPITGEATDGKA